MFKSLKPWANIPVTVRSYLKRDGAGTKQFGADLATTCYAAGKVEVVTNAAGKEVVSNKQLYIFETVTVTELDNIIFEGKESEIKAIGYFYDNGLVDLRVVYL